MLVSDSILQLVQSKETVTSQLAKDPTAKIEIVAEHLYKHKHTRKGENDSDAVPKLLSTSFRSRRRMGTAARSPLRMT